jgi:hypothetical protein
MLVWRFSRFEPVISKELSAPPFTFSVSSLMTSFTKCLGTFCKGCHGTGQFSAKRRGEDKQWAQARDLSGLYRRAAVLTANAMLSSTPDMLDLLK